MKTSNRELIPSYPKSTVRLFYLINLIITNLFIISTLFFILYKKIKYKWIWMLLILVANITIQVNYINGHWNVDIGGLPFTSNIMHIIHLQLKLLVQLLA